MSKSRVTIVVMLTLAILSELLPQTAFAQSSQNQESAEKSHIIQVAQPTGEQLKDHASIVEAFKNAQPGDTIQFARGMYIVGKIIRISTPQITILGDSAGTVLRGCNPNAYKKLRLEERKLIKVIIRYHGKIPPDILAHEEMLVKRCGSFQLTGGHAIVRNLTFEYMRLGLVLGYSYQQGHLSAKGGYLIEGNTFRNSDNSIRIGVSSPETTVIRRNNFVDTYHAVEAGGSNIHILNNTILAPAPTHVPANQYPSQAIGINGFASNQKSSKSNPLARCNDNVIAGNVIEGYPDGIALAAFPKTVCSRNIIRNNTIAVRRVVLPRTSVDADLFPLRDKTDSTFVGIPISISAPVMHGRSGILKNNLLEGNRILGAEGYGIEIRNSSGNHILNNTITGIIPLDHFPGNGGFSPDSRKGNGCGIWVSHGSNRNNIANNLFQDIGTYSIVLEGNNNIIQTTNAGNQVYDLGIDNQITKSHVR